jgi:arylsulfatase A-like enzyme
MIDEKIGQILQTLEEKGYLEDAVVIFTSDHGDALGDHGHSQKWTMYDVITRVPLIVWSPGRFPGGRTVDGLCQLIDIAPVIMELAGIDVSPSWETETVMPVLQGETWVGRDYVFAEHGQDGILQETEFMTMVRSREWKLVHFLDEPFGQLFNLVDDPEETKNLWDDVAYADKKRELLDILREWHIRSQYKTREWTAAWR